jgi:hypothetical protein
MTDATVDSFVSVRPVWSHARAVGFGLMFWLAFLLALEPGNLVRAGRAGLHPGLAIEATRIAVASLLGALTCPLILWLARRFPIRGRAWPRHAALHAASAALLAPTLIVIGAAIATWMPPTSIGGGVADQVASNVLLLIAAMAVLDAGAHLLGRSAPAPAAGYLSRVTAPARGRTVLIDLAEVDWIEAQGNYIGLRAGDAVHLVRGALTRFEARLDPAAFVRIHRRTIVNLERVREVVALGNGDALVRLRDGAELRASRGFGAVLHRRLRQRSTIP